MDKCLPFSFLLISVFLLSTWNRPVLMAVVICTLEHSFWMLGGGRRTQAFHCNDACWNVSERDDESGFFFLPPLLILSSLVSFCRLSRSVWIIDTRLSEFDFISQFPEQLKGKGGVFVFRPSPHTSPQIFLFLLYCKCTDVISVIRLRVKC